MHDVAGDAIALSSALLASVSHDLRNPLSVIIGASEVLQDRFAHLADDDRHDHLRSIRRECIRIDEYVQGLLQATRLLVGGTARLVHDWVAIEDIVGSAVERLRRYRDNARVSVGIDGAMAPIRVHGALVEQALLNVLDNAAKFSPPGTAVTLRAAQDANGDTHIDVVDAGPGVSACQRERIFAFFESHDPQSRGRAGSGLGLAISRSILRAHGGDVVAVEPGDGAPGTRMRLTLPKRVVA
jgi:two-component system sensor histidine kinase KdpD